jgi:hypothetical protein
LTQISGCPPGTTIGQAYAHIFDMLGIPSAAVTDYTSNTEPFELLTGAKPAWPTLVDMADYTNTLIAIDYLNNITLNDNIMWNTDVISGGETYFDRTNARQVTMIQERPGGVKQVKMEWVHTDGSAGGTIVYPDPEYLMGDYKTLKSSIYPSAELAMASLQRRFTVLRYPATIAIPDSHRRPVTAYRSILWSRLDVPRWQPGRPHRLCPVG